LLAGAAVLSRRTQAITTAGNNGIIETAAERTAVDGTDITIVTLGTGRADTANISGLVTCLRGAGSCPGLAASQHIAALCSVTKQTVIAESLVGDVATRARRLIAAVVRASNSVVTTDLGSGLTHSADAGLGAVAEHAVRTVSVNNAAGGATVDPTGARQLRPATHTVTTARPSNRYGTT